MTINLAQLLLLGILTTTLHWLVARSEIARPFWSWDGHPAWFTKLLACAGCSGFWLGAFVGGMLARVLTFPVPYTPREVFLWWFGLFFFHGLLGIFLTPVFEAVLLWGLRESAIAEPAEEPEDTGSIPNAPASAFDSALVTPVDSPIRRKPR